MSDVQAGLRGIRNLHIKHSLCTETVTYNNIYEWNSVCPRIIVPLEQSWNNHEAICMERFTFGSTVVIHLVQDSAYRAIFWTRLYVPRFELAMASDSEALFFLISVHLIMLHLGRFLAKGHACCCWTICHSLRQDGSRVNDCISASCRRGWEADQDQKTGGPMSDEFQVHPMCGGLELATSM